MILLDFGLMAELEDKVRIAFAEFFYAMVVNDGYTCAVITLETASHVPKELDRSAFTEEIILLVERYSGQKVTCFQVSGSCWVCSTYKGSMECEVRLLSCGQ